MSCRAQRQGDEERARKQAEYLANPKLCECGRAVSYEKRHTNKYCSTACVNQFQPRRQADPANYHTFNCLNCSKEVTRRKSFNHGSAKYCSNSCAQRHTKKKHYIVLRDDDVVLDSSYEAFFWGACLTAKIPIERFDRTYAVEWLPGQWYAPDFWLPSQKIAIETKGMLDESDPDRWKLYRNERGSLLVLTPDKMETFITPLRHWLETIHRLGLPDE